ncbi:MAG: PD40 domain-containing protein, partial [Bacteroidales bacterium]|nr:PD40 domain-containing protein [Bacteroidales bacterium]
MKAIYRLLSVVFIAGLLHSCASVPQKASQAGRIPSMTPDYAGATIPSNIAPLAFAYDEDGARYVTVFSAGDERFVVKGKDRAVPPMKAWKKMMAGATRVDVETYMRKDGVWTHFEPFHFDVAGAVDQFLSYRLIPPNFENFEHLSLSIRDLTSYNEREFYNNELLKDGSQVQCMNCHHFRNYGTDEMQFHVRQYLGGTMILREGEVRKVNMKNDSTISSGVYPAWNPVYNYIAYSTNFTYQEFHSHHRNLLEVIDDNSQLILYDLDRNEVQLVYDDPDALECFPAWAPDGRRLYFTSAYMPYEGEPEGKTSWFYEHYEDIRYDLYSIDFNPDNRRWGEPVKVIDASSMGR